MASKSSIDVVNVLMDCGVDSEHAQEVVLQMGDYLPIFGINTLAASAIGSLNDIVDTEDYALTSEDFEPAIVALEHLIESSDGVHWKKSEIEVPAALLCLSGYIYSPEIDIRDTYAIIGGMAVLAACNVLIVESTAISTE